MALSKMRLLDAVGRWTVPNLKQFQQSRQPMVWLLAPFIGLAAGGAAILFRLGIGVFQLPWLGTMSESVTAAARAQPWWAIAMAIPRPMPRLAPVTMAARLLLLITQHLAYSF